MPSATTSTTASTAASSTASSTVPGRREQNKAATRAAIAGAARRLLQDEGPDALTAEKVADAAGVSRRTLFNYFPSVEAVLNAPLTAFLDRAAARLVELPADLPPTIAAVDALASLAGESEGLATVADVFMLAQGNPQLARLQLEAWDQCAAQIHEAMSARVPAEAGFELVVYVHAVVGAGRAAFQSWADRHLDDYRSDAALADLQQHLTIALEQLRDGFPALRSLAPHTPRTRES
jgi:AcrR family transcriptional regulator